jgi:GTP-binding protein
VPVGTSLYDQETGELIHDFQEPDEQVIIAKGGRGGRGNQHFATSTHQAPREHELGRAGEERHYRLELKLLADVGLVGYPNAGKSTLISRISAAKAQDRRLPLHHPRTQPRRGHRGRGAGSGVLRRRRYARPHRRRAPRLRPRHQFLRHIERTRLLVHLVDVSDASGRPDPVEDFKVINKELASFTSSAIKRADPFSDDDGKP